MNVRTLLFATALVAASFLSPSAAEEIGSAIDAVTVYSRGAEVTRVARISLQAGANILLFDGFPGDIDLERVQAETESEGVELRSIRLDVLEQREAHDAEVRRLQEAITEVQDSIAAIDDDFAAAELQLKFLEGLAQDYAASERKAAASGQADISSWQQALDSLGSGASETRKRMRKASQARREAEKDLSVLERELENKKDSRADSSRLIVSLASQTAQEAELRFTYFQPLARWRSSYAAYLDTTRSELRLDHAAEVRQATSEDWSNVRLTLSTGDPGSRMQAPEQESQFLDLWDPETRRRRAFEQSGGAFQSRMQAGAAVEEVVVSANVITSRYSVTYQARERADVSNSTDQAQSVPLAEYRSNVSLITRATPRRNARAYLTARLVHGAETPLFPGRMRVFVDGAFTGITSLPELLPGTEAVLPMGPDRQVEVTVVDQGGEKGREGLLSSRNTELTDFLFEVTNRHSKATQVEVIDFYPAPRDERIEVSPPRSATDPDEKDFEDRPGVVVWRKELEPGARWRILHQYEVSYPRDTILEPPR